LRAEAAEARTVDFRQSRATSGTTSQLIELLTAVADLPDQVKVVRLAVEHAAAALGAEVAMVVVDEQIQCAVGPALVDPRQVATALRGASDAVAVARLGSCAVLVAPCDRLPGTSLLVARSSPTGFDRDDAELLRGLAQVLSLALKARQLVEDERGQRTASDVQAADNAALLASLGERQVLLERLSRIQRSISSRQPLLDVLDAIVAGAADLLREDIVGLRLIDPADEGFMVLASSIGVPDHLAAATLRQPIGQGIGGRAIVEKRLVHTSDYPNVHRPLPGFAADGILSAMAAPVRQGARAVGSLVVATRRPHRASPRPSRRCSPPSRST
jgi:hypothetical protein